MHINISNFEVRSILLNHCLKFSIISIFLKNTAYRVYKCFGMETETGSQFWHLLLNGEWFAGIFYYKYGAYQILGVYVAYSGRSWL